jgi:hypothetical protein
MQDKPWKAGAAISQIAFVKLHAPSIGCANACQRTEFNSFGWLGLSPSERAVRRGSVKQSDWVSAAPSSFWANRTNSLFASLPILISRQGGKPSGGSSGDRF